MYKVYRFLDKPSQWWRKSCERKVPYFLLWDKRVVSWCFASSYIHVHMNGTLVSIDIKTVQSEVILANLQIVFFSVKV